MQVYPALQSSFRGIRTWREFLEAHVKKRLSIKEPGMRPLWIFAVSIL